MNLAHLRYAVEVERTGSITKAADNLFMGQPNLSKAIKELEAAVGTEIFKRTSKGVVPTAKGAELLNYARNILAQVDEMQSLYRSDREDKLTLSLSIPRASYITHAFTNYVNSLEPDKPCELHLQETNSMGAIRNVIDNVSNLGIIRCQAEHERYFLNLLDEKELQYHTVWEFRCLILMSKLHPLAKLKQIPHDALRPYTELAHGDLVVPSLSHSLSGESDLGNRCIYLYERGSQFDLLRRTTGTYMFVSPMPQELMTQYGLVQRRCTDLNITYRDMIIYPRGYKLREPDKAFINELLRVKDEMVKMPEL